MSGFKSQDIENPAKAVNPGNTASLTGRWSVRAGLVSRLKIRFIFIVFKKLIISYIDRQGHVCRPGLKNNLR